MLEIAWTHYTDPHLQGYNPPTRLGNYRGDLMDKMRHVMEINKDFKGDFTTCGGDLFHPKKPETTKHGLVRECNAILRGSGVPNYIVPGNHDLQHDSMESLDDQPLGSMLASGVLIQMRDQIIEKVDPSTGEKLSVQLWSYDFNEEPDLSEIILLEKNKKADVNVLGIHVYASPKGGQLFKSKIHSYEELSLTGHDIYLLGHYHADQGVQTLTRADGTTAIFVNIGSLSRGDYGDENLDRKPKCCCISVKKDAGKVSIDTKEMYLRARPAAEVFDLEKKEKLEQQKKDSEQFVEELQVSAENVESGDNVEFDVELGKLITDKEILKMSLDYLEKSHAILAGIVT